MALKLRSAAHHIMRTLFSFSLLLLVAATMSACADTTSPTAASPATTSDVFTGSLAQSGTTAFPFTVSTTGTVTTALTSVAPLATMSLGVGIGSWDGTNCTLITSSKNDNARSGVVAVQGQAIAGTFCVDVYDSGNVPADWTVDFTVQVTHP